MWARPVGDWAGDVESRAPRYDRGCAQLKGETVVWSEARARQSRASVETASS